MASGSEDRYYCYTDAGGTFTDTLVIDHEGHMWSGKAPTTPASLDDGHIASIEAALRGLGITMEELLSRAEVIAFGTTAIINTIVQRSGARVGAIVTKGFERVPSMGRSSQNYSEYSWNDILHSTTHRHLQDLVDYEDIVGVTERIDANGKAFIPLYEHEVKDAVNELIDKEVESLPLGDLVGVHVKALGDYDEGLFAFDRFQGHLGFEGRRVVASRSFRHWLVLLLGVLPGSSIT